MGVPERVDVLVWVLVWVLPPTDGCPRRIMRVPDGSWVSPTDVWVSPTDHLPDGSSPTDGCPRRIMDRCLTDLGGREMGVLSEPGGCPSEPADDDGCPGRGVLVWVSPDGCVGVPRRMGVPGGSCVSPDGCVGVPRRMGVPGGSCVSPTDHGCPRTDVWVSPTDACPRRIMGVPGRMGDNPALQEVKDGKTSGAPDRSERLYRIAIA